MNGDGSQHLFAPDVQVGEDGRYYLFYCLHRSPTVSVAVCDEPAGEYQFYGHIHYADGSLYGQKAGDVFNFDPGVFRDDDGKIYLYTGLSYLKDAPMRKFLAGKGLQGSMEAFAVLFLGDGAGSIMIDQAFEVLPRRRHTIS